MANRTNLALIGGFLKPRNSAAHGTLHASYMMCQALAEVGGYGELHVYQESPRQLPRDAELALPSAPRALVFDKGQLLSTEHRYQAIYPANGEQIGSAPYLARPMDDWAPVICSIGTAHISGQWSNLLVALCSGAVRASDGLIFKSRSAQKIFEEVFQDWEHRLPAGAAFPRQQVVIPNGVDVEANKRSDALRAETRRQLRIGTDDVVFLAFSRLSPGTKGDQLALLVRWKQVLARLPRALLVLSGAVVDRSFVSELRNTARAVGVADRVLIVENPFELMVNAGQRLMSAADVFVHLTTGVEEASSLVVHEAMGHALPVIATDWSGLGEVINDGVDGYLIPTVGLPVPRDLSEPLFAVSHITLAAAAGQLVSCDWRRFVDRAVELGQPERRSSMAAAARKNIEGRTLHLVARRYADFFAACSRQAEASWDGRTSYRALVNLQQVLEAQGALPVNPAARLRLRDRGLAALLAGGQSVEEARRLEQLIGLIAAEDGLSLGQLGVRLAAVLSSAGKAAAPEAALAGHSRLLVKLINFGAVDLDTGAPETT